MPDAFRRRRFIYFMPLIAAPDVAVICASSMIFRCLSILLPRRPIFFSCSLFLLRLFFFMLAFSSLRHFSFRRHLLLVVEDAPPMMPMLDFAMMPPDHAAISRRAAAADCCTLFCRVMLASRPRDAQSFEVRLCAPAIRQCTDYSAPRGYVPREARHAQRACACLPVDCAQPDDADAVFLTSAICRRRATPSPRFFHAARPICAAAACDSSRAC